MQRITITIDDDLLETLDRTCRERGYTSRSEAVRDLVRGVQSAQAAQAAHGSCVATLTYVYEHAMRNLPTRLTSEQHHHDDIAVATLHVHLDPEDCMEISVLRGDVGKVQALANSVMSQRGVRHSNLHVVPLRRRREWPSARKTSRKEPKPA